MLKLSVYPQWLRCHIYSRWRVNRISYIFSTDTPRFLQFQVTQFPTYAVLIKWNFEKITFLKRPLYFTLRKLKRSELKVWEEYCWTITLAAAGVMLRASKCQCVGFWISTVVPFVYVDLTTRIQVFNLDKMRLAPDLQEGGLHTYVSRDCL